MCVSVSLNVQRAHLLGQREAFWLRCPGICEYDPEPPLLSSVVSDLCATGDHDCEQVCISSPGSYTCACHEGFTLNSDGKTCNGQWLDTVEPWAGGREVGNGRDSAVLRRPIRGTLLSASGPVYKVDSCLAEPVNGGRFAPDSRPLSMY